MKDTDCNGQTRRGFCARATALAMFGAFGAILPGCGSPTSPSDVASLPTANGTPVSGGIAVTIDASSPLSAVGERSSRDDVDRQLSRLPHCSRVLHGPRSHLHAPGVHDYRFRQPDLRVSMPWLDIRHERAGGARSSLGAASAVRDTVCGQHPHDHSLNTGLGGVDGWLSPHVTSLQRFV